MDGDRLQFGLSVNANGQQLVFRCTGQLATEGLRRLGRQKADSSRMDRIAAVELFGLPMDQRSIT
jgi:hypothetical protein